MFLFCKIDSYFIFLIFLNSNFRLYSLTSLLWKNSLVSFHCGVKVVCMHDHISSYLKKTKCFLTPLFFVRDISHYMVVKLTIGGSSKGDYSTLIQRANFVLSLEFDLLQGRWLRSHRIMWIGHCSPLEKY